MQNMYLLIKTFSSVILRNINILSNVTVFIHFFHPDTLMFLLSILIHIHGVGRVTDNHLYLCQRERYWILPLVKLCIRFPRSFHKGREDYTAAPIIKVSWDENVISEGVNVWCYPGFTKGFAYRGNGCASKTESKYWRRKTLGVLCLTFLGSM